MQQIELTLKRCINSKVFISRIAGQFPLNGEFKKYVRSKFAIFEPLPPYSSLFILHVPPWMYVCFCELSPAPLKESSVTFMNFRMKNPGVKREKRNNFLINST